MKVDIVSLVTICVTFMCTLNQVYSIAVMSVDFGSEWMKIGIVSPGVPMEIVLNKESKRKTPAVISFRDGVRTFGEEAQTVGIRFPHNSYSYLLDLLGKSIDNPIVKLYQKRFPHREIVADPERGTVLFKQGSGDNVQLHSPEELIAQLLQRAKQFAEISAGQPVNECVLTVPGFFNQAERTALLQAADLANLRVLQLLNDYSAVALNYGIFRRADFNNSARYVLFFDMGASKTSAAVVSYQVKPASPGSDSHPQLTVLGVGYDRTLGGLEMQLRLRDHLAKSFDASGELQKNARSMAKLFREAGRVKDVLSANTEHTAQVEGLLGEKDFRSHVTREEFEKLCADLRPRVAGPVQRALAASHLTMDVISQVVLVGAATRTPWVQDELERFVKTELARNVNADEAAAMGAAYRAAELSTGFKVKRFATKDAVLFPVQVSFERKTATEETVDGSGVRRVRRTLFGLMNPYPQKKVITFNKHTDNFNFSIGYGELDHLPVNERENIGPNELKMVSVSGLQDAINAHGANDGVSVETRGVKAHFNMDDSGILALAGVELVLERTAPVDEESPLSKLGTTISKLFTSGSNQNIETSTPQPPTDADTNKTATGAAHNTSESADGKASGDGKQADLKPKIITVKEALKSEQISLAVSGMSTQQVQQARSKLDAFDEEDRARNRREKALNTLESHVVDALSRLDTDEYSTAISQEEAKIIRERCAHLSEWLYEGDGIDADAASYEREAAALDSLTRDWYGRVMEHRERPDALAALDRMLEGATNFMETAKNLTSTEVLTEVEVDTLKKLVEDTTTWREKMAKEQDALARHAPVTLSVSSIFDKMTLLDREVKYLVNKLKIWRAKKNESAKKEAKEKEQQEKTDKVVVPDEADDTTKREANGDEKNVEESDKEIPEEVDPHAASLDADEHSEL